MFRMVFLTLGGFCAILLLYGTPEMAGADDSRATPPQVEAAPQYPAGVVPAATAGSATDAAPERMLDHAELTRIAIAAASQPGSGETGFRLSPSPDAAPAAAAGDAGPVLYVTGSAVNLRAAPGGKVLGALGRGTAVTGLGPTTGPWVEIEAADGQRGFMSANYLSPRRPG